MRKEVYKSAESVRLFRFLFIAGSLGGLPGINQRPDHHNKHGATTPQLGTFKSPEAEIGNRPTERPPGDAHRQKEDPLEDGRFQKKPNLVGRLTSLDASEVAASIECDVDWQYDKYQQDQYVVDKMHSDRLGEDFERYVSVERGVGGLPDLAHAALAKEADDVVVWALPDEEDAPTSTCTRC